MLREKIPKKFLNVVAAVLNGRVWHAIEFFWVKTALSLIAFNQPRRLYCRFLSGITESL
jgi:hypothetical protein